MYPIMYPRNRRGVQMGYRGTDTGDKKYRKYMFHLEIRCTDSRTITMPTEFVVTNGKEEKGVYTADVSLPSTASSNDLLSAVMSQGQVSALQEILPSMNDIFIEAVSRQ